MAKEFFIPDQWCAQETCQVLANHNVWVYSEGIEAAELERYHFRPLPDMAAGVRGMIAKHGPDARWAVVPDGPMVILPARDTA